MKRNDKIRYVTPKQAYQRMTRGAQQTPVTPNDAARALFGAENPDKKCLRGTAFSPARKAQVQHEKND